LSLGKWLRFVISSGVYAKAEAKLPEPFNSPAEGFVIDRSEQKVLDINFTIFSKKRLSDGKNCE